MHADDCGDLDKGHNLFEFWLIFLEVDASVILVSQKRFEK